MRFSSLLSMALCVFAALIGSAQAQSSSEQPVTPSLTPGLTQGEAGPASAYAWAGLWFSNHYVGGYGGAIKALNETDDLWSDGWVLRFDASGGSYRYDSVGFSDIRVGTLDADVMVGYRNKVGKGTFSAYIGPSYAFHHNPDPAADIRGTEFGVKILADYSGSVDEDLDGYVQGSYSTTFSTYAFAGRLLYRVSDAVWLGPQITLYGNNAPYQESTFGPYIRVNTGFGELGFSGGYRHVYTSGHPDGYFASVVLGFPIE